MIVIFLILTLLFGGIFLGVKAYEWNEKFEEHHIPGRRHSIWTAFRRPTRAMHSCSSRSILR